VKPIKEDAIPEMSNIDLRALSEKMKKRELIDLEWRRQQVRCFNKQTSMDLACGCQLCMGVSVTNELSVRLWVVYVSCLTWSGSGNRCVLLTNRLSM